MTIDELGRQVKAKHPEYGNYDDSEVGARVLSKYPEYRSQVDGKSGGGQGVFAPIGNVVGAVGDTLASRPELKAFGPPSVPRETGNPINDALDAAQQTLAAPIRTGVTLSKGPDVVGQTAAEEIGRIGYPKTGAAVGTAIQMAPELLAAKGGLEALYDSKNPSIVGRLNTTKELGPQYDAQNEAIGVTRRVPPEGGISPRYAPPERIAPTKQPTPIVKAEPIPSNIPVRYPSKPGDFLAYANGRLQNAAKGIAPQELMDWQVKLQTDMSNGTIPRIDPTTGRTTTIFQQATDLLNRTKGAFNNAANPMIQNTNLPEDVIPSREGLNSAFKIAAQREAAINAIKKAGGFLAKGAGAYYAGKSIVDKFSK